MTTARLIALCSPAMGSGKSTAAEYLVGHHRFVRLAFATPLKAMATTLLRNAGLSDPETYDRVYGDRKEEEIPILGMTSRRLMQALGTEFGREMIREDIWVDITMANARVYLDQGISVVIDDMRFPNEYHGVVAAGGECYRVVRPAVTVTSAHVSEGQLDLVAMPEVWNTGSPNDLYQSIDALLRL